MTDKEKQQRLLLKHFIFTQLLLESADDCINEKALIQKEKHETKKYIEVLEKRHRENLKGMYGVDSKSFINLTHIIETIICEMSEFSLEEWLTFNQNMHEYIKHTKENTPTIQQ